jgi:seryl-tRNA synthetase
LTGEEKELSDLRDKKVGHIGNIVHESVPVSNNEDDNKVVATWGEKKSPCAKPLHHHELLWMIDGYEPQRGVDVAGHRAYFLKGAGVLLNQALINFGLAFLMRKSYTPIQPPFFMRKEVMSETAQLEEFDEALYKVVDINATILALLSHLSCQCDE